MWSGPGAKRPSSESGANRQWEWRADQRRHSLAAGGSSAVSAAVGSAYKTDWARIVATISGSRVTGTSLRTQQPARLSAPSSPGPATGCHEIPPPG